jgi:hypothetical protein
MAPRCVQRWHKRTSWHRRGTELGAIGLGAELCYVHKTCLAQLVELCYVHKSCGREFKSHDGHVLILFFVFVTDFFCCPDFSFMSLICPSRFISYPDFFCFCD